MERFVTDRFEAYVFNEVKRGNTVCGDVAHVYENEQFALFTIADGLGNGPYARQSSVIVAEEVERNPTLPIDELLHRSNERMLGERGAAVAIVKVHFETLTLEYSGIGNIRMYLLQPNGEMVYPLPVLGYVSGRTLQVNTQSFSYERGARFYMHSDGIVAKSPKQCLTMSYTAEDLAAHIVTKVDESDDATFIAVQLL